MIDINSAKHEVLKLAQYLAPSEQMTAWDGLQSLRDTVARIAAAPSTTPVQMALIAAHLAGLIEAQHQADFQSLLVPSQS